ncbi:MAG TPA: pilus assembly protein TadG-related protein, partial [Phototrophicaceae bacterium]|nr:pilus assembly protein TadG-related protein [Phototrophicaceae bacterium]
MARRLTRKGESGQAVIILALGFIGLIAFVGIVTDVSLMFVRYSTLSRAVDAAAIAAAGQMRSDRNFGEVGLAARQFIEFHGLNPVQVLVETCQTAPQIPDPDPDAPPGSTIPDPGICPKDQRKLVRVSARVKSPTIFMRLLGFNDIELTAVAISETAVLDVVVIMDVGESMLFETTYKDWNKIGMGKVYVPPRLGGNGEITITDKGTPDVPDPADIPTLSDPDDVGTIYEKEFKDQLAGTDVGEGTQRWLPAKWSDPINSFQLFWDDFVLPEKNLQQDVNDRLRYTQGGSDGDFNNMTDPDYTVTVKDLGTNSESPRFECRVRFWPYSNAIDVDPYLKKIYTDLGVTYNYDKWDGFVPTFNFYGCCNDPTVGGVVDEDGTMEPGTVTNYQDKDFRFNDLICQPFKQARDATRRFIDRIDFARGDRIAFVTFGRSSFLIDPDGANGFNGDPATDPQFCVGETAIDGHSVLTPMIESKCRAIRTLDKDIGVLAEPDFYVWKENGGGWDGYANGLDEVGRSYKVDYSYRLNDPEDPDPTGRGHKVYNNYPVKDNCPLQNGALS